MSGCRSESVGVLSGRLGSDMNDEPPPWVSDEGIDGKEARRVLGLTDHKQLYELWRQKRLPTESRWSGNVGGTRKVIWRRSVLEGFKHGGVNKPHLSSEASESSSDLEIQFLRAELDSARDELAKLKLQAAEQKAERNKKIALSLLRLVADSLADADSESALSALARQLEE